jgi:hypothetical protein
MKQLRKHLAARPRHRTRRERGTVSRLGAAAIVFATVLCRAPADRLHLKDKRTARGRIREVHNDRLVTAKGNAVPLKLLARLDFDAEPVVAKPDGLVLTDGSVLSGTVHRLDKTTVRFRSTALGPLALPLPQVSALYFGGAPDKQSFKAPPKGQVRVTLRTGAQRTGAFFTASRQSMLIRTSDGMEKIDFQKARYVVFAPCRRSAPLTLRNGDRIGRPLDWKGRRVVVQVDDKTKVTLKLEAVRTIEF